MNHTHLLNAAFMPASDGLYDSRSLDATEFATRVRQAHLSGELVSYIGYPETAELLSEFCKVQIPTNRSETTIKDNDVLLTAKLRYRVNDPKAKGTIKPSIEDFEFRFVLFMTDMPN